MMKMKNCLKILSCVLLIAFLGCTNSNSDNPDSDNPNFTEKFYTIKFESNGGSGSMEDQIFYENISQQLSENEFIAPNGYFFEGWSEESEGQVIYTDKQSVIIKSDKVLYAIWKQKFIGSDNGGLFGEATNGQTQGAVLYESWKDTKGNLIIDNSSIDKTSEVVIVPTGTVAAVNMQNDSSWNTYYNGTSVVYKGVFLKDRKVKICPYIMGQYEVTQKLYESVMNNNPSYCQGENFPPANGECQENRPVEHLEWNNIFIFCNRLTKKVFGESTDQCVYYSDENFTKVYEGSGAIFADITKKGYRLPTEAEWEYAARGGDPNSEIWKYAFAGCQSLYCNNITKYEIDSNLNKYGWYKGNANSITHEVGLLEKNSLNLYDMSGNVWEWCWDNWDGKVDADISDEIYTKNGYVENPQGAEISKLDPSYTGHVKRGGAIKTFFFKIIDCEAFRCVVSYRYMYYPVNRSTMDGFRICRSQ